MLNNTRSEIKTTFFFVVYFLIAYVLELVVPGGAHAPGLGIVLFFLSFPISIIYSLILYFKYNKSENRHYLNSICIISGFWIIIFLIFNFD